MNWANLPLMNGQQAPTGRPTVSGRQSTRLEPYQTASMSRNLIAGQASAAMIKALSSVSSELSTLPNSCARSAASAPTPAGGGSGASSAART